MIIRRDQTAYLGKLAFIHRIRKLIWKQFPEALSVPRHELDAQIFRQLQRAERYGLHSENAAATYVMTAWLLGPEFDQEYPAVHDRLSNPQLSEALKVLWLQTFTIRLLDGPEQTGPGSDHAAS